VPGSFELFSEQGATSGRGTTPGADGLSDREQLELLRHVLALSEDAFVISDPQTGAFLDCSRAAHERLGYNRKEYLALGHEGLQADPDHDRIRIKSILTLIAEQPAGSFPTRHRHRDGRAIDVQIHYRVVNHRGQPLVIAMHRDQSELVRSHNHAHRLNQLLLEAEQLTRMGSWELIHATGELVWSEGTYRIFESTPEEFSPSYQAFLAAIHPDDRGLVDQTYTHSLQTRQPYQVNHRLCFPDGPPKVVQERGTTTYDREGQPVRSIGTVQDITQLAEYEQKLERAAYLDPLTGLPNRQAAIQQLQRLLEGADSGPPGSQLALVTDRVAWAGGQLEQGVGVLNLDLDQFQAFNDTFGPQVGDRLLREVASLLQKQLPPSAFLARIEGDEFLILLSGEISELEPQAQRIQQQLQQAASELKHLPLLPTVSVGIAHLPSHSLEPHALLQAANTALGEAKRRGKGSISTYSNAISQRIRQRLEMETELEDALSQQSFHLVYQPQVDGDGDLVGAEVLLRWKDRHGVPIPPSVFIPLTEQTGQIHAISAWVMEESCRQLRRWREQGLQVPRLAINLSAVQLSMGNGDLARSLVETVRSHGLEPEAFELEITETALIKDPDASQAETIALAQAGFRLAIDDFGTGYASLTSLHTLPVNTIKIDLSFIQRLSKNASDQAIVRSTILMAHELGLLALGEGVESEQQLQILQGLGCDLFQGYLFGVPMAAEAFRQQLLLKSK